MYMQIKHTCIHLTHIVIDQLVYMHRYTEIHRYICMYIWAYVDIHEHTKTHKPQIYVHTYVHYTMVFIYLLSIVVVVAVATVTLEAEASDEEAVTVEVFNIVVFTNVVFNSSINCCPLRPASGLAVVPNTLNASVTENLEATVLLAKLGATVTGLFTIVPLIVFRGITLLAVIAVVGVVVVVIVIGEVTLLAVFRVTG